MPKVSGLTFTVTVDDSGGTGRDISNDITSFDFDTPRGTQDITGVDKSAVERILLLADGTCTLNGVVNTTANKSHDVFKTVPTQAGTITRTVVFGLSTGGTLTMEMVFTGYSWKRGEDGSLTWSAPGMLANGTAPAWT
jgi:hypothetical protein